MQSASIASSLRMRPDSGTVLSILSLILQITSIVSEARQFRPECRELGAICAALRVAIQKNHSALESYRSRERLEACLTDVEVFVSQCTQRWNLLKHAREVFLDHKLPQLRQRLLNWVITFTLEESANTASDLQSLDSILRTQTGDIQFIRKELEAEARERNALTLSRTPAVKSDFLEGDKRLNIVADGEELLGTLEGRPIVLANVNKDEMKVGRNGYRHVEIYKRISVGALVQSFYGICERGGKKYAIMEDLRGAPTLAAAIEHGLLPSDNTTRLRISYELANTIAYLHSVGILIKSLSDETVMIRRLEDGSLQPCLTHLETARTILEPTALLEFDVRFEAPEYPKQTLHTKHTDVWSLGTVVWECMARSFPFSTPPVAKQDKGPIRNMLKEGNLPWDLNNAQEQDNICSIVKDCWNANPTLRPSAAFAAQTVLDILVRELVEAPPSLITPHNVLVTIKERVLQGITLVKEGKEPPAIDPGDVRILRESADSSIDPVSSFLLGTAILHELVPVHMYERNDTTTVSIEPHDEVKRLRVALRYLEIAVDGDIEEALRECGKAHHMLAKHYVGKH